MLLQMAFFRSFLRPSSSSLCVWVYVCIHLIFFIHSPVNGRLGCFHVLAIVNSAAVNTRVHVSVASVS